MNAVRNPAVAGRFYPGSKDELHTTVRALLEKVSTPRQETAPKALIAPHAGYIYSGDLAAQAYKRLQTVSDTIKRVVLMGPCHRVAVKGLAAPGADAFDTPLGVVPVDKNAIDNLVRLPQVSISDETHRDEHALEVHLPFLQTVLEAFAVIPLVVGDATSEEVAQVLDALWGGDETLIVISSDLSHYLDYETASSLDDQTRQSIEAFDPDAIRREQACGRIPVKGLLHTAKNRGMTVETIDVLNSGDTAGPRDRVVGYGAWAFYAQDSVSEVEPADVFEKKTRDLLAQFGTTFLKTAGASIMYGLAKNKAMPIDLKNFPPSARQAGACFVTLTKNGQLRGCTGSPEACQPLIKDIAHNAYRAAFADPRFPDVSTDEIETIHLSLSVLSPQTPMIVSDEADLLSQLRPGKDGLVIADGKQQALFLPSVWRQLPKPDAFLAQLKQKAGMPENHWSETFMARRFVTKEIRQSSLPEPEVIWVPAD